MKIIEEKKRQQEERIEIARRYVNSLRGRYGGLTAIVYGSTARGDFKDWSDLDLIIVAEWFPKEPLKRLELLYDSISEGQIEPKGYSPEEFKAVLKGPFGRILEQEGIVLIDDLKLMRDA